VDDNPDVVAKPSWDKYQGTDFCRKVGQ